MTCGKKKRVRRGERIPKSQPPMEPTYLFFEKGTNILMRDSFKGMIIYKIIFTCKGNTCLAVD